MNPATLELTQKIQLHFPRDISAEILKTWNGCNVKILTERLNEIFSKPFKIEPDVDGVANNQILSLLTTHNNPVIKATDGKRYLAKAKKTFESYVDPDFKNWNLDQASQTTPETPTNVYEMIAGATFVQIFSSLSGDLDKLYLTQEQIEEFCLSHRQWLRTDGNATFFLFKENNEFFVAGVDVYSDGLRVCVCRLEDDDVWLGDCRHRVVVPQL